MIVDIFDTENRYDLICADPPWKQTKGGRKSTRPNSSGGVLDYPTCSVEEIKEHLRAATELCGDSSVLFYGQLISICLRLRKLPRNLATGCTPA